MLTMGLILAISVWVSFISKSKNHSIKSGLILVIGTVLVVFGTAFCPREIMTQKLQLKSVTKHYYRDLLIDQRTTKISFEAIDENGKLIIGAQIPNDQVIIYEAQLKSSMEIKITRPKQYWSLFIIDFQQINYIFYISKDVKWSYLNN